MEDFTLRQGEVTAKLSQVRYSPDTGFQADNTWYVDEAYISAESDTKLTNGPGIIDHDGKEFPITVRVFDIEASGEEDGEDEDNEWKNPVCEIEIGYAEGVKELARALGLD